MTKSEFEEYKRSIRTKDPVKIGLRIAAEEEASFDFYTSRLGIRTRDVLEFYVDKLKGNEKFQLKMLHFFMNKGIKDDIFNDFSRSSYRIKVDGDTSKRLSIEEEPIVQV